MTSAKVFFSSFPRLAMGVLFVLGTFWLYPAINKYDFTTGSWLYEAGSWCFAIAALQDLIPQLKLGLIPSINASLYVFAAGGLITGSLWFNPNVIHRHPVAGLGQKMYTFATVTLLCAVLWDMSRLLLAGAKPLLAQVLAMLSAIGGAICFLIGAILLYSVHSDSDVVQINYGVSFFMAGSWFFVLHSLCYTVAVYQYSKMLPAAEEKDPGTSEVKEAPVEEHVKESA